MDELHRKNNYKIEKYNKKSKTQNQLNFVSHLQKKEKIRI